MKQRFEEIYATSEWGKGSGEGSYVEHTKPYVRFLERFIRTNDVRSVVDMGCGDWQFSQTVNWQGARYQGFDIVESVVRENQSRFSSGTIEFFLYEGDPTALPEADLLIAKDVLQHWSQDRVQAFLPVIQRYRFALITNCVEPNGETPNQEIEDGAFRRLDINAAPFHWQAKEVFQFTHHQSWVDRYWKKTPVRWLKKTYLLTR